MIGYITDLIERCWVSSATGLTVTIQWFIWRRESFDLKFYSTAITLSLQYINFITAILMFLLFHFDYLIGIFYKMSVIEINNYYKSWEHAKTNLRMSRNYSTTLLPNINDSKIGFQSTPSIWSIRLPELIPRMLQLAWLTQSYNPIKANNF